MSEDQTIALVGMLGAIVLVSSSLVARRLPLKHVSKLALIWIVIFIGVIAIVGSFPKIVHYFT